MKPIYLDYSATTPPEPAVIEAMAECFRRVRGNPASQHQMGRQAQSELADAAESICELLGGRTVQPGADQLILTSGGTEANNLALLGWAAGNAPGRFLVSSIEHPSVIAAAQRLSTYGHQVEWIGATCEGVLDLDHLDELLASSHGPPVRLVSVMWGNSETGVLQPISQVVQRCRERNIAVHTDASQAVGKCLINFHDSGVTMMTIAGHKFNGPCGIGGLLVRGDQQAPLKPILYGGSQQLGMRPGTEPVPLVVGMQVALQRWSADRQVRNQHVTCCRDRLEARLTESPSPAIVNGTGRRLPHTLNLSFPAVDRQPLLMALDLAGVCCSSGSACASGSSELSHVLQAMNLPAERVNGAIRLSVGIDTVWDEVDSAAERILAAVRNLKAADQAAK